MLKSIYSEIREKFLLKGSFVQNLSWTMSGNVVMILVQLVFSPILTRIYGPEAYGSFSLFSAIAFNISNVASLQYDKALILPADEGELKVLLKLCFSSIGVVLFLFSVIIVVAPHLITQGLGLPANPLFLYGLVPYIALLSINQVALQLILRNAYFKASAVFNLPISIGVRLFNLGYGLLTKGGISGLVMGEMISNTTSAIINYRKILRKDLKKLFPLDAKLAAIKEVAIKYKKFPLYDLPGTWVGIVSGQLPLFLLGGYAGISFLGFYGLANSLLIMPLRLLSYSLLSVFTVKASELMRQERMHLLGAMLLKLYWTLFLLGLVPFVLLAFAAPSLFAWIFGHQWEVAGQIASILAIFTFGRLIVEPFMGLYRVQQQQQRLLIFQIVSLLINGTIIIGLLKFNTPSIQIIGWYAVSNGILTVYQITDLALRAKVPLFKIITMATPLCILQAIPLYLIYTF